MAKETATYEKVWETIYETQKMQQETQKMQQETDRLIKKQREDSAETDRRLQETDRLIKELRQSNAELLKSQDNFDIRMENLFKSQEKTDIEIENLLKSQKKTDIQIDKLLKAQDKLFGKMNYVDMNLGGISRSNGAFAEEYFYNSFERGKKNFFGEKFDKIEKNVKGINVRAEYDVVLINGKSIAIIEVKYNAQKGDINEVIKKAETFRINYSDFVNHHIYLALAALTFEKDVETDCAQAGIAVIKQKGKSVVIYDEHLKKF
jgi:hypothetical protein